MYIHTHPNIHYALVGVELTLCLQKSLPQVLKCVFEKLLSGCYKAS